MTWHLDGGLRSNVARRVVALFVACALLPMVAFAIVTLSQTSRELEASAQDRLRFDAKIVGMDLLARLEMQAQSLRIVGMALSSGMQAAALSGDHLGPFFAGGAPPDLAWTDRHGATAVLAGTPVRPMLSEEQHEHLDTRGVLLVPGTSGPDVLVVRVRHGDGGGDVSASVIYPRLYSDGGWDVLPPEAAMCVYRGVIALVCHPDTYATPTGPPQADVDADGGSMAQTWLLPLRAHFGTVPLSITLVRSREAALQPLRHVRWNLGSVVVLTLLGVLWISVAQVRRQLQPLALLIAATRRLSRRDFAGLIQIRSGDEFQELGDAFTHLSNELQQQFAELEAFNQGTLEALGRTIDAKSPWTAGHSSRVTEMAVLLAEAMPLSQDLVAIIRRGGPVHDIGKLATPGRLLDKAGALTPEEMAEMRRHPVQGVHILEPIAAFRPLLPVVAQHHERWDGNGYPAGLAGEAIHITGRVLAVADVFDALRSHRPYRLGMPLSKVVRVIEEGSGSHFDPSVVEAFRRVVAAGLPESLLPTEILRSA